MSSLGTLTLDLVAEVGKFTQGLDQASRVADRNSREIQKNLQKIDERFDSLTAGVQKFAAAIGVGLSAVALSGWIQGAMQAASATSVFAGRIDVSVESLTAMRYVAGEAGVAMDSFDASMMRLTRRLGAAKNGGGPAIATLERLGLSADRLLKLPLEERLKVIGGAMKGLETQAQRLTAAQDLAGDSARQLVPMFMMQSEEIDGLIQQAEKLGYVYSTELAQSADEVLGKIENIKGAFSNLSFAIAGEILPSIESALSNIDASDVENAISGIRSVIDFTVTSAKVFAVIMAGRFAASLYTATASFVVARMEAIRYQATLAGMAGVSRSAAIGITAMGTASRIASLSMAALGGPVGILAIAASSLIMFGSSASAAGVNIDELDSKIMSLNQRISTMTERQALSQKLELTNEISDLNDELSILESEFSRTEDAVKTLSDRLNNEAMSDHKFKAISDKVQEWKEKQIELGGKIDDTTASIVKATEAVANLDSHMSSLSNATEVVTDDMLDKFNKMTSQLQDEIGRIGLNTNVAVFEYELKNTDKYSEFDVNGPEIKKLRALHAEKDAKLESLKVTTSTNRASSKGVDIASEYRKIMDSTLSSEERRGQELSKNLAILQQFGASEEDMLAVRRAAYESMAVEIPGMGEGGDTLTAQLARINENMVQLDAWREQQMQKLEMAYGAEESALAESLARKEEIEQQYRERRAQYEGEMNQELLNLGQNLTSDSLAALEAAGLESSGIYKAMFLANKASAFANAIISSQEAGAKALAIMPGPAGVALSKMITGLGMANAGIIAGTALTGMAHSGIDKVPETGTWLLEKGERVVTANTSAKLDATLESLRNQNVIGGGETVVSNVYITLSGEGDVSSRNEEGGSQLGKLMEAVTVKTIIKELKPGGILARR